jgi:hypothetical protein
MTQLGIPNMLRWSNRHTFRKGKFVRGTCLVCGLVWQALPGMFLSTGHRNFVAWSTGQRNFLSTGHRVVSHRPSHEITVSNRQKHPEQCLPDQATNEECPTDKFPFRKISRSWHGVSLCRPPKCADRWPTTNGLVAE